MFTNSIGEMVKNYENFITYVLRAVLNVLDVVPYKNIYGLYENLILKFYNIFRITIQTEF